MKKILFTSKTCPHCVPAKEILKDERDLEIKDIEEEGELLLKYRVRSVPTLITECECEGIKKYVGVTEIQEFLDNK